MLDFSPQGLDGLNTVAGYLTGTAVVILGILVAVGCVYFGIGRSGGRSQAQERGFRMVGIGLLSVMILSGIVAAITWGISQGGQTMLPDGAAQQDVRVEREAPTTTCDEQAVRDFEEESDPIPFSERKELVSTVSGGELMVSEGAPGEPPFYVENPDADTNATMMQGSVEEIRALKWYPTGAGGDCSASNESAAADTVMDLEVVIRGSEETVDFRTAE